MESAKYVLSVLLTVCLTAIGLGAEEPFQPDRDIVAEVEGILAKFESSLATQGVGTAVVRKTQFESSPNGPEVYQRANYYDFRFTPSSSRTDSYELLQGDNPARRRRETRVWAPESLFRVYWSRCGSGCSDPSHSLVTLHPSRSQRRVSMSGVDFDPQGLLAHRGRAVGDVIRSQLTSAACTVTTDANGLAIVRFEFSSGGFAEHKFDSNSGHTLVESEVYFVFSSGDEPDSLGSSMKVEYSKAQEVWYPVRIHYEGTQTYTPPDSSVLARKEVTTVEITAFDASAAIADSDFTLEGVGVPKGASVRDKATGIEHQYGVRQALTMDFTDVLDEIKPDLTAEAVEWANADAASPAAVPQEDASPPPSQNHLTQTTDDAAHTASPSHRFMAAVIVAVIAIIIFVVFRCRRKAQ